MKHHFVITTIGFVPSIQEGWETKCYYTKNVMPDHGSSKQESRFTSYCDLSITENEQSKNGVWLFDTYEAAKAEIKNADSWREKGHFTGSGIKRPIQIEKIW